MPSNETMTEYPIQQRQQPPSIQPAPSAGSASLDYSMETDAMADRNAVGGGGGERAQHRQRAREREQSSEQRARQSQPPDQPTPPRIQMSRTAESLDYSVYSSGEMSADHYYAQHAHSSRYADQEYGEQVIDEEPMHRRQRGDSPLTADECQDVQYDATATVHDMHRKLLYLLSHPELFSEAIDWQSKVDRGLDPSRPDGNEDGSGNGIKSFDNEFEEQSSLATTAAAEEHKDDAATEDGQTADGSEGKGAPPPSFRDQGKLLPPLPLRVFAPDAEVVLPQALTASQLFGVERVTGIELEAAAGTLGLSRLFLRWLALMPEGDHANVIDPPGLTVMRISGGRYRVTGAHRAVWRWMNKFPPQGAPGAEGTASPDDATAGAAPAPSPPDTDFDFGDLVTMTIVDVFETDADGRLLSYCPTFDNRAVHKTQEVTERLKKGATHLKERMEVVARSPAGKSVNKAAGSFGKMSLCAALAVGSIVRSKIEGIQHPERAGAGGDDARDAPGTAPPADGAGDASGAGDEGPAVAPGADGGASRGDGYFSDDSVPSRQMEI